MATNCPRCGLVQGGDGAVCPRCGLRVAQIAAVESLNQTSDSAAGSFVIFLVCALYLLNFFFGVDFVPDNIPIVGNLDDVGAVVLMLRSMVKMGWLKPLGA